YARAVEAVSAADVRRGAQAYLTQPAVVTRRPSARSPLPAPRAALRRGPAQGPPPDPPWSRPPPPAHPAQRARATLPDVAPDRAGRRGPRRWRGAGDGVRAHPVPHHGGVPGARGLSLADPHRADVDVSPRRLLPRRREHALPVDLRQQRGG